MPVRGIGVMFQNWFDRTFNKVDEKRIKEVGIDRAAAEWILRCGGAVQWKGASKYLNDYNNLPPGVGNKIFAIDLTDSAVMEEGFPHLRNLKELRKVKIWNSKYINDQSMGFLCSFTRDQLMWLKIGECNNISDKGLEYLHVMKKLEYLHISSLPGVDNPERIVELLKSKLTNCNIEYPPFTSKEEVD